MAGHLGWGWGVGSFVWTLACGLFTRVSVNV